MKQRIVLPARGPRRGSASGPLREWVAALLAGALLGAVAIIPPVLLADRHAFAVLVVLLALIAAVYLGFALVDGRASAVAVETLAIAAFAVVATTASATMDARWLAGGLLAHAGWDAVHHRRGIDTAMPGWYVPLCIGFDVVVAAYVMLRF